MLKKISIFLLVVGLIVSVGTFGLAEEQKVKGMIIIHPETKDVKVLRQKPATDENVLEGKIKTLIFLGEMLDCQIVVGQEVIRARLHPKSGLKESERVYLTMAPESLISIEAK